MSVQISIVHYADRQRPRTALSEVESMLVYNDILIMLIKSIKELTKYPYRLNIIDNQMDPVARKDLEERLPNIEILRTEGPEWKIRHKDGHIVSGRHHTFPVGANLAMDTMKGDYLVMFHTDLLVSYNWLTSLVQNLKEMEKNYGVPCATSPLLLPYPRSARMPSEEEMLMKIRTRSGLTEPDNVKNYMDIHGVPNKMWGEIPVAINKPGLVTDNGHQLGGAYIASKRFFNEVGHYDPCINRMNDKSYGIKTLTTRCKNTISNHVYLHHIGGLHKRSGCYVQEHYSDKVIGSFAQFVYKWGRKVYRKTLKGGIWIELHQAQVRDPSGGEGRRLVNKYMKEEYVEKPERYLEGGVR